MRPCSTVLLALALATLPLTLALAAANGSSAEAPVLGDHVKVHFRMDGARMVPTSVLALEDDAGDPVMHAYVDDDHLYISDGREEGVDRTPIQLDDTVIGGVWHRLDVVLDGATYTLHIDQREEATARTFTPATQATYVPDPRPLLGSSYEAVTWARHRVDDSAMAYDETFTSTTTSWEQVAGAGTITVHPTAAGDQGIGRVQLTGPLGTGVSYLRAPTAGFGATYTAEASVASRGSLDTPVGLAVLAGLTGPASTPEVAWALVADVVLPSPTQWALFFMDAEGHRTQVSPAWNDLGWHRVRASVDEAADQVRLTVDEVAPVTLPAELGTSTHMGAGDVFTGLPLPGGASVLLDDLALYEAAT